MPSSRRSSARRHAYSRRRHDLATGGRHGAGLGPPAPPADMCLGSECLGDRIDAQTLRCRECRRPVMAFAAYMDLVPVHSAPAIAPMTELERRARDGDR